MEHSNGTWVLTTYAEEVDGEYPNAVKILKEGLAESLAIVEKIFNYDDFDIMVRNISPDDLKGVDFKIVRHEDNQSIGEISFEEEGTELIFEDEEEDGDI